MLIAGVSTLLFNANPLLRFDGYYILSDLIEIPNLRQRAQQYLAALFERRLFGLEVPLADAGLRERAWLLFFAVASFIYRISITLSIAAFIATQYFILGVLLALWAVIAGVALPIGARCRRRLRHARNRGSRDAREPRRCADRGRRSAAAAAHPRSRGPQGRVRGALLRGARG